jgi:hypothetical protein
LNHASTYALRKIAESVNNDVSCRISDSLIGSPRYKRIANCIARIVKRTANSFVKTCDVAKARSRAREERPGNRVTPGQARARCARDCTPSYLRR